MTAHLPAAHLAAASSRFDRSAAERTTPGLVDRLREDPSTGVLVIHGDAAQLDPGASTRLRRRRPQEVPAGAEWAFLGRTADGTAQLVAAFDRADPAPYGDKGWVALRAAGGVLESAEAEELVTAVSLGRWLTDQRYCPACGGGTRLQAAGWSRVCARCAREHFPRTDPAIIVAVESAHEPARLLLGSNVLWGANRYSCFAGFVEAGESAESAVARELFEEAGIVVRDVRYRASQAWPYPRSLMLGFRARADVDGRARPDGDEIASVRWFTRDEIAEARERGDWATGSADGGLLLPGRGSIAYRLISQWWAETA